MLDTDQCNLLFQPRPALLLLFASIRSARREKSKINSSFNPTASLEGFAFRGDCLHLDREMDRSFDPYTDLGIPRLLESVLLAREDQHVHSSLLYPFMQFGHQMKTNAKPMNYRIIRLSCSPTTPNISWLSEEWMTESINQFMNECLVLFNMPVENRTTSLRCGLLI